MFTDQAIKTCLQLKVVYGLTLRQAEGFVESLFELMGLKTEEEPEEREEEKIPVPDYTTLSKRQGDLDIDLKGLGGAARTLREPLRRRRRTL